MAIHSKWSSGDLIFYDGTQDILTLKDDTDGVIIGQDAEGVDVYIYGAVTEYYVHWDADGDTNGTWYFGQDDYGVDVVFRGQAGSASCTWDASGGEWLYDNVDIQLGDNDYLRFGDAADGDVYMGWVSATSLLEILPATDNTGAINIGNGTKDIDLKIFMGATTSYVLFDNDAAKIVLVATDIDLSTSTTGVYEILLNDGQADALSITRNSTDVIVFDTSTPRVTITPAVTITGAITCDSTTNSTSSTTGSIQTDGGLGVALNTFLAGSLTVGVSATGADATFYSDVATIGVFWDHDGDTNSGVWSFGASGGSKGTDVILYGDTNGGYVQWDSSADDILFYGAARMDFANATLNVADNDIGLINMGTYDTALASTATPTANTFPLSTHISYATNAGSGMWLTGSYTKISAITNAQGNNSFVATMVRMDIQQAVAAVYGIQSHVKFTAGTAQDASSEVIAISAQTYGTLAAGTGYHWGMKSDLRATNTPSGAGHTSACFFGVGTVSVSCGVYIEPLGSTTMYSGVYLHAAGNMTNCIETNGEANMTYFYKATAASGMCAYNASFSGQSAAEPDASLKVTIAGNDLYIYCYPTAVS